MKYAGVIVGVLLRLFLFSRVREALRIKPEMLFLIMLVKRGCFRMVLPVLLACIVQGMMWILLQDNGIKLISVSQQ